MGWHPSDPDGGPTPDGVVDEDTLHLEALKDCEHERLLDATPVERLTGLPAALPLLRELEVGLGRFDAAGVAVSLAFADLDGFGAVNDRHGRAVGDQVLVAVAAALCRQARAHDVVARYADDKFLVVLIDTGLTVARAWADLARTALHECRPAPLEHPLSASFGVATRLPAESAVHLWQRADDAMLAAKQAGRDRIEVAAGR